VDSNIKCTIARFAEHLHFNLTLTLKLKIHARSALNGKDKTLAFDHDDGKVKGSKFPQAILQKQKSRFHRQLTAKNDFYNRLHCLPEPIGHPPENLNKIKI